MDRLDQYEKNYVKLVDIFEKTFSYINDENNLNFYSMQYVLHSLVKDFTMTRISEVIKQVDCILDIFYQRKLKQESFGDIDWTIKIIKKGDDTNHEAMFELTT